VLVAAVAVVVVVVVVVVATRDVTTSTAPDGSAARSFVAAWRRSLEGTWTARGDTEQGALSNPLVEVQRPPDRLTREGRTISGRLGGRSVSCVVDPTGAERCHDGGAAGAYGDDVDRQVAIITGQVGGPAPIYLVQRDATGCFALRLSVAMAAPPYGERSRFCFDGVTGGPTRRETTRGSVTEVQRFTSVTPTVAEADLALPAPLEA